MLYPSILPNLDVLWNDYEPREIEDKLRYLIEPAQLSTRGYYLQLLTQIARAQALQGNFAGAHATLDSVERELSDATEPARVRSMIERARIFLAQDAAGRAMPLLERALQQTHYYPHLARQASELLDRASTYCVAAA